MPPDQMIGGILFLSCLFVVSLSVVNFLLIFFHQNYILKQQNSWTVLFISFNTAVWAFWGKLLKKRKSCTETPYNFCWKTYIHIFSNKITLLFPKRFRHSGSSVEMYIMSKAAIIIMIKTLIYFITILYYSERTFAFYYIFIYIISELS